MNLSHNKIGDVGAMEMVYALGGNTSLHTLNLSHNYIGDDFAEKIAGALTVNHKLLTLYLTRNKRDYFWDKKIGFLKMNHHLQILSSDSRKSSDVGNSLKMNHSLQMYEVGSV